MIACGVMMHAARTAAALSLCLLIASCGDPETPSTQDDRREAPDGVAAAVLPFAVTYLQQGGEAAIRIDPLDGVAGGDLRACVIHRDGESADAVALAGPPPWVLPVGAPPREELRVGIRDHKDVEHLWSRTF